MDVLTRIKRAVLARRYVFSEKARIEMETDDLTEADIAESILNADAIYKRVRSTSPHEIATGIPVRNSKYQPGRFGDIYKGKAG